MTLMSSSAFLHSSFSGTLTQKLKSASVLDCAFCAVIFWALSTYTENHQIKQTDHLQDCFKLQWTPLHKYTFKIYFIFSLSSPIPISDHSTHYLFSSSQINSYSCLSCKKHYFQLQWYYWSLRVCSTQNSRLHIYKCCSFSFSWQIRTQ